MSTRNTTLDPKILAGAKKEFLEKGFLQASLQSICSQAGVTTGAIYKRYRGKEELFNHVVEPAVTMLNTLLKHSLNLNEKRVQEDAMDENWTQSLENTKYWIRELFREKETFKILVSKAEGTRYSNFVHDFIQEYFTASYEFMKELETRGVMKVNLSYEEYHILITSYCTAVFEMFTHDFTLEQALTFAPKIDRFFAWKEIIEL